MANYIFFNYQKDRNWEGEIRVQYLITQNTDENYSDVYIESIEYRSNVNGEGWGRTATWTVYGTVGIEGSDSSTKNFNYFGESFNTYGTGWVDLGDPRSGTLRVYHRSDGTGEFDVILCPVHGYDDFNVFHPNGGTYNCEIPGWTYIRTTLPTIVQSAPTIDLSVSVTDLGAATLTAYASTDCTSWQYKVDSGSWTNISGTGTSKSVSLTGMTGTHTYQVRATGSSSGLTGYSSTVTKSTDTDAPTISLSVSVTDLGAATLSASANVSCGSWQYQVDGGSWTSVSGTGTSKTINLTGMTGTHTYRVRATKSSNNVTGYSSTVTKSTDTAAPTITLTASVDGQGNATLSASADVSCSSWAYQVDGAGSWNAISGTGTSKSVTVPGMTGTHRFQVKATKTSNNVVGYSAVKSTTSDQSTPTISLIASYDTSAKVTLLATADVSCNGWAYKIDSGSWHSISGTAYDQVIEIPGMTGYHTFQVKATKVSNSAEGLSNIVEAKTPTLSLSSTAVSTSGSLTITANYLPYGVSVLLKYGNTVLDSHTYGTYQDTRTISLSSSDLASLFSASGVTTEQSITVTVSVDGYSYTATRFTLSTGSNMSPTVGTPTATNVKGDAVDSSLASVYIAGFSKVKIAATVTAGSGASIAQHGVWLSYGTNSVEMENTSGNTWEATTTGPITGNTTFTVTATDTRGLTGSASYSLTGVKSWTAPVITFDTNYTYRCSGTSPYPKQEGGPYVRVKVNVQYTTSISGNAIRNLYFYIQEDGTSTTHDLTSGTQSAAYALASPRPNQTITVVVQCRDKVGGYVSRELQLQGGHRDFALANYYASLAGGNVTALGIGMAPDLGIDAAAYGDTIQLPARGRFTVGGFELQNFIGVNTHNEISYTTRWEKNLLACDTSNPFAEDNETIEFYITSSDLANWTNIPSAVTGTFEGTRFVAFGFDNIYVVILEYTPVAGRIWVNVGRKSLNSQSITWNGWKGHTPDIT